MEKIRSIRTVLAFSLVFLLAGCSGKQDGAMTIQKAELTEKEQQTVALIAVSYTHLVPEASPPWTASLSAGIYRRKA